MDSDRYKWIALSNTTLGVLLATLDASIILIAMPNIFRGIKLDPLVPGNSFYLLWMILGYLVVTSVPIGLFGTVWAYLKLEERSVPRRAPIDWWGNVTFALGLVLVMVAVTYGIRPANGHPTGWTSPKVLALMAGATISLIAFAMIER